MLDRAEQKLLTTAVPRAVWRIVPRTVFPSQEGGRDLERHLQGCDEVLMMAATLGSEVDTLLRRMELTDIALAATADAMASVLLEQVCDALEAELRTAQAGRAAVPHRAFCARATGDCPLELNDEISRGGTDSVRGAGGMAVTAQHLLAPRKSTTALLGVADHPVTGDDWRGAPPAICGKPASSANGGTTCFSRNGECEREEAACAARIDLRAPPFCDFSTAAWEPELQQRGLQPGQKPELAALEMPEIRRGHPRRLMPGRRGGSAAGQYLWRQRPQTGRHGLWCGPGGGGVPAPVPAVEAADQTGALVGLDIGPLGELLAPAGTLPLTDAYAAFAEIVACRSGRRGRTLSFWRR